MKRVGILMWGMLLAVIAISRAARADHITSYTADMAISDPITNMLAFDEGAGINRITPVGDIVGPGVVTLVNPDSSINPVDNYFLIGLTNFESTEHVVVSMTADGVSANTGKLFSEAFAPFHESQLRQAILDATSGLPANDPAEISALSTLNSFAATFHDELYAPTGTNADMVRFSLGLGVAVPAPAAVWGGLLLLPLVGLMARRKLVRA